MAKLIAGLNMDLGVQINGILHPAEARDLTYFVLANLLPGDRKRHHRVPVLGDLFGYKAQTAGNQPIDEDLRLKLNTAPIIGTLIISNLYDEAALSLFANLDAEHQKTGAGEFSIGGLGRIVLSQARVFKKYEPVISSLDLEDVSMSIDLQSDNRVMLDLGLGLPYPK